MNDNHVSDGNDDPLEQKIDFLHKQSIMYSTYGLLESLVKTYKNEDNFRPFIDRLHKLSRDELESLLFISCDVISKSDLTELT